MLNFAAADFCTRAAQGGADGVFGNSQPGTDLAVAAAFEMVLHHDLGLGSAKPFQHPFDFFAIVDARCIAPISLREIEGGLMRGNMT